MTTATGYLAIAAMMALRSSNLPIPRTRPDFHSLIVNRYGDSIKPEAMERIIRQLSAWGIISVITDKYAGETLGLYPAKSQESFDRVGELGYSDVIAKGTSGGVDWFARVFNNQEFWEDITSEPVPEVSVEESSTIDSQVPASDRLVTRSDNRLEIEVLEADVRGLVEELESNNEAAVDLGDEKDVIVGELKAAESLVSQPVFRLTRLATLILPGLKFLADKFASGAIGELAKRLIAAILGLG
jgi:hypothetical protein